MRNGVQLTKCGNRSYNSLLGKEGPQCIHAMRHDLTPVHFPSFRVLNVYLDSVLIAWGSAKSLSIYRCGDCRVKNSHATYLQLTAFFDQVFIYFKFRQYTRLFRSEGHSHSHIFNRGSQLGSFRQQVRPNPSFENL
jgi:hypothetical protein